MANIINLDSESGSNYIGDDAEPAVEFSNSSTGPGLRVKGLVLTSTASIDVANIGNVVGATAGSAAVTFKKTVISTATSGVVAIQASGVSVPVFQLEARALVSCSTITFTTGAVAGTFAIRVCNGDGTILGWIPVLPSGSVTAAAV